MADSILDDYFTRATLAQFLDVSERSIERWDALRVGPPRTHVGGRKLYRKDSVREWLQAREESAA